MSTWKSDTIVVADPSTVTQVVDDTATEVPSRHDARVTVTALELDLDCDALELDDQYDVDCDPYNRTGQFCVGALRKEND